MVDVLEESEIAEKWQAFGPPSTNGEAVLSTGVEPADALAPPTYRHFIPLERAADEWVYWASHPDERIMLGIEAFDRAMRGVAPQELCLVNGFAHVGKTVIASMAVLHNAKRRMAWFTPDESRVAVLVKLTALVSGVGALSLERMIAQGGDEAKRAESLLRETATEHLPNLAVFDDAYTIDGMTNALREVQDHWGEAVEFIIYDYADLLQIDNGEAGNLPSKMNALKQWGRDHAAPLMVMHQSSRGKGADGQETSLTSGGYGGEQQATFVIGVSRRRDAAAAKLRDLRAKRVTESVEREIQEAQSEYEDHRNTVTLALHKVKRPPSDLVPPTDFYLDPATGALSETNKYGTTTSKISQYARVRDEELF